MKILLVGSGGREHALAWKLSQSNQCETLYCAPGNAGIAHHAQCVDISDSDIDGLVKFVEDNAIDFVVVGPEAPLVAGLTDRLNDINVPAFGPSAKAAQLEGSKGFMKSLCSRYDIPTAAYGEFSHIEDAVSFIEEKGAPIVVKADGLAAGKGVIIAMNKEEAIEAATEMLSGNSFGDAGAKIIIEEFMDGEELSFFALADGNTVLPLTSAQDHKRAFDGDEGPNTGGMGAYSPAHMMSDNLHQQIMETIIYPTVEGMQQDGCPFTGVLYAGIMLVDGTPKLLEYNARFGDPECQPIMMRLDADLVEVLLAAAQGTLAKVQDKINWRSEHAMCVVMATKGYPGSYPKDTPINGLSANLNTADSFIFHAGTKKSENDQIVSIGGRVLGITALGNDLKDAQKLAYNTISQINWPDGFYRKDIGWRAIADNSCCEPTQKTMKN